MGRMLTPQRLLRIAKRIEEHFDAMALVLPVTQVEGPGGSTDNQYPDISNPSLTQYGCRIYELGPPSDETVADQQRTQIIWEVQLPVESRINPSDRLYVTGADAKGNAYSRLLEVVGPAGPRTWEAVRLVRCFEVFVDTPPVV